LLSYTRGRIVGFIGLKSIITFVNHVNAEGTRIDASSQTQ